MAVQMAHSGSTTMSAAQGVMPADCPMMQMIASSVGVPSLSSEKPMDGKVRQGCQTCQLCMSLAGLNSFSAKLPEPGPFGPVMALLDRYSSAELFEDSKPPIS